MLTSLAANLIGAALQNPAIDARLLQRFLTQLVGLVALTILSAFMSCMVVVGLLYGLYELLVGYGLQSGAALVIVLCLVALLTGGVIAVTVRGLRQLRALPLLTKSEAAGRSQGLGGIVEAFLDGFINPHAVRR